MFFATIFFLAQASYPSVVLPPFPPPFEKYPAASVVTGKLAAPRLKTAEERRFRETFIDAITKGYSVVDGGTEHERRGVNFAGHYVLVQWGCGTDCLQAALIDAKDGTILHLPEVPDDSPVGFQIPTGSVDLRALQFRWNSRLLGIPRISDRMTYFFVLEGRTWRYLEKKKTPDTSE